MLVDEFRDLRLVFLLIAAENFADGPVVEFHAADHGRAAGDFVSAALEGGFQFAAQRDGFKFADDHDGERTD